MSIQFGIPALLSLVAFAVMISSFSTEAALVQMAKRIPDKSGIREKLMMLDRESYDDYLNFRIAQLVFLIIITVSTLISLAIGYMSVSTAFLVNIIGVISINFLFENKLKKRLRNRTNAIHSEFPQVVEMLTLCIGAGESPVAALARISLRAEGFIANEIKELIRDIEEGASLTSALDKLSRELNSYQIRRFVDALIISISRGTSLTELLMAHARDARSQERNLVLKAAAKAEITMMIPVVFLILPISIIFALFPSLSSLTQFG